MKTKRLFFRWVICGSFFVSASMGWAVTAQEIQKTQDAMPARPVVEPVKQRTMLVFTLCNGFKHSSIPYWTKALEIMGQKTGAFSIVHSEDMSVFSADSLKQFDVICLNNTTKLTPNDAQKKAIMDFIKGGKGIVGIHAATDNFDEWPQGAMMMGGTFKGHPWLSNGTWAVRIDDPDNPLMRPFGGKGFKINDEIYRTLPPQYSRVNQRVLMSLDMSDPTTKNAKGVMPDDMDTGISWIKYVGKGRLFYCSLGHNNHITWNRPVLEHYLAGIQYAMGDLKADDTPLMKLADTLDPLVAQLRQYDWDKSRVAPARLHALIGEQYENQDVLKAIEAKLLGVLESNVSMAVKDFICRELAVIGTGQSLGVLTEMLVDEQTADIARYALENIPDEAADEVLLQTLAKTESKEIKIGIITTLGTRKCEDAIPPLAKSAQDKNDDIAKAAIRAMGAIGNEAAANKLALLLPAGTEPLKPCLQDALLNCADSLNKTENHTKATGIYRKLYDSGTTSPIRAAGLIGLLNSNISDTGELLQSAVASTDAVVRKAAMQTLVQVEDEKILEALASGITDLSDAAKIQLLSGLAANPKKIGKEQSLQLLDSPNSDVRIAACQSLGKVGDAEAVGLLAAIAAKAVDHDERDVAREALYLLAGRKVDNTILRKIAAADKNTGDEKRTAELIRATAQRQIAEAPEVLFRTAMSDDAGIASESVRALRSLAGPEYMEEWVDLLVSRPNKATEDAVIVVAKKISEANHRADLLMDKYASMADNEKVKISILRVMGNLGDKDSISLLRKEYASSNEKIKTAAFRAMMDWPGSDFIDEMKAFVRDGKDAKTKILAFRAYTRMLAASSERSYDEIVDGLIVAFGMAERPEEQRLVIGLMSQFGTGKALAFVAGLVENPQLKAEAEVGLVGICEKLAVRDPAAVKLILLKIKNTTKNKSLRNRAKTVLGNISDLEGFVCDWQVSGPYAESNGNLNSLFDRAFLPETNPAKALWKPMPAMTDSSQPWLLDITRIDSGNNRVAYLKTTVVSPKIMDVIFEVGSDDGVRIWLNGKEIHGNNVARGVGVAQDKVKAKLIAGSNEVLVKVTQGLGGWGFCMRIVGNDSKPISVLEIESR